MLARARTTAARGRPVERAVRSAARGHKLVLAVSGGRDSMALLHAAARAVPQSVVQVATFDHGTGPAATKAANLVAREAARLGFPVVVGHSATLGTSEAAWRTARMEFLHDVARRTGGVVATAHTRDDQVETVLMRVLRDTGPRGLAGLYATTDIVRPLLELSREAVAAYAREVGAVWVEDPTNSSLRYLRNRVRRDLLPALSRSRPGFEREVLAIARAAARWREQLDALARGLARVTADGSGVTVSAEALAGFSRNELAVLWPAIAARVGLAMDWRGIERAAAFTIDARIGSRIPLTGGWAIARARDVFELVATGAPPEPAVLRDGLRWGAFTFAVRRSSHATADAWYAQLPAQDLVVRAWKPGDRMRTGANGQPRRVKRFLSDSGITGARRASWPVVVAGGEVVWIPGVRRAAIETRQGQLGVPYTCDRDDR